MYIIDRHDKNNRNHIFEAIENNNLGEVRQAIDIGSDINNIENSVSFTPLMWAARFGYLDIVKYSVRKNADINHKNNKGWTVLMVSAIYNNLDIVKYSFENGNNINIQGKLGSTAIMLASFYGYIKIVKLLFDNGANINYQDKDGQNALMLAIKNKQTEVADYLNIVGA